MMHIGGMNNEPTKLTLTFKYDGGEMHTLVLAKDLPNLINAIVAGGGTILSVAGALISLPPDSAIASANAYDFNRASRLTDLKLALKGGSNL